MSRATSTRDTILDAAIRLVSKRDSTGITMAQIAASAHVSRQALYLHFTDRAALIVAMVQHLDERLGIAVEARRSVEADSGEDALRRMVSLRHG